jgi:ABC-type nitrate/sulfonate/bicarbonate transport system substrate-binding protein
MKKFISLLVVMLLITSLVLTGCNEKPAEYQKVRLIEVTHSIFYTPQYVALEMGLFEKQGLSIELTNGNLSNQTNRLYPDYFRPSDPPSYLRCRMQLSILQ